MGMSINMTNVTQESFRIWLKNKGLRERTIKNYLYLFNRFTDPRFNQESVSRFLVDVKDTAVRSFITNYKTFLMKNRKELEIEDDYYSEIAEVELVMTGRKSVRLVRPLNEDEISLIEKYLESEELKLMLLISYKSGLRLNELISVTVNSFNWVSWKKDYTRDPKSMGECIVFGKGGKEGIAFIPPVIMVRIKRFLRSGEFKGKDIGSRLFNMGERTWQMKLRKAGFDSGLTKLNDKGKPIKETVVHPHRLRHSLGGNLIKKGMDIRLIQEILRHSSIQSTQIYTQIDTANLKSQYMNLEEKK